MARSVIWTKERVEEFVSLSMMTETEEKMFRDHASGMSNIELMFKYSLSESSVGNVMKRLKAMYDEVQPSSKTLPPRVQGVKNLYKTKIK